MTEHSELPWEARLHEDPQWMVCVKDKPFDVMCLTAMDDDEAKAKDIVACHNALVGLKPEKVEALVEAAQLAANTMKDAGARAGYCTWCGWRRTDDPHEQRCILGNLEARLAEVKAP